MPKEFDQNTVLCRRPWPAWPCQSPRQVARRIALAAAWLVILCCIPSLFAQLGGKGEVKGTVKDSMGAVVPTATITATENSTSVTITRKSNSTGDFDLSPLDPGIYTIVVSAPGFEKQTQENIQVNALETQDYNPVLVVARRRADDRFRRASAA